MFLLLKNNLQMTRLVMKITKDIDIPIDGLAVTLATFILSPDDTRIRNALVVAALH
jgi:hypothetical protein